MNNREIDLNEENALTQIVDGIKTPLNLIIETSNKLTAQNDIKQKNISSRIIFFNSLQIKKLIDELSRKSNNHIKSPVIFKIYNSNDHVKSLCKKRIYPKKISHSDILWLLQFEKIVNTKINHANLNLYDLSYDLSVSERHLYRKIRYLLHVTPNQYVRILKLYKAKKIIDDFLYNKVSQISYAVGYNDTYYFSKLFKEQYGVTPKKMLKNNYSSL